MSGVRKGERWGAPAAGPADVAVSGDDPALAEAVARARDGDGARVGTPPRVAWTPAPDADFARAVSASGAARDEGAWDLPCDAMVVEAHGGGGAVRTLAVNLVVVGAAPDRARRWDRARGVRVAVDGRVVHEGRAAGVVVANGEFLRGADVVPRGHPGDGRLEVQVDAVPRRQRRALRARVRTATHVPHPAIVQASGRRVEVEVDGAGLPLEADGVPAARCTTVTVAVIPQAFVLVT